MVSYMKLKNRLDYLQRRHKRVRQKLSGTAAKPRLCVSITNKHMYIQFIDDVAGRTLLAVTTKHITSGGKNNVKIASMLGKEAATKAIEKGIKEIVFDRGGRPYKGRVHAIANAVREAGIKV
jgi:large subunit ribosomal protein L18